MSRYLLVVPSSAKPGRTDEYHQWYDSTHLADVLAIPGVVSGKRYDALPTSPNPAPADHIAMFEIEVDDPVAVIQEIGRRAKSGEMVMTDSVDRSSTQMWLYAAH